MTEEKKYYTPDLEEFHIGFKYETYYNEFWHSNIFGDDLDTMRSLNEYPNRVKHLDKSDIESLGGVKIKDIHDGKHPSYDCFFFKRPVYEWFIVMFNYTDNWCTIYMENHKEDVRFYGTIKNKSELKRILKQLGI